MTPSTTEKKATRRTLYHRVGVGCLLHPSYTTSFSREGEIMKKEKSCFIIATHKNPLSLLCFCISPSCTLYCNKEHPIHCKTSSTKATMISSRPASKQSPRFRRNPNTSPLPLILHPLLFFFCNFFLFPMGRGFSRHQPVEILHLVPQIHVLSQP